MFNYYYFGVYDGYSVGIDNLPQYLDNRVVTEFRILLSTSD